MVQNIVAGLQGIIDHILVGRYVGFTGNAAIGVSWQIFMVMIVFAAAAFSGMGILVARFAGANRPDKVNRVAYQGLLTGLGVFLVLASVGVFLSSTLLSWVNASPEVAAEALPYLRTLFLFSFGLLFYFMAAGALRAAGDPHTPLRLGVHMTVLNLGLSIVLIRGFGPIPAFGTLGAAMGTVIAAGIVGTRSLWLIFSGRLVIQLGRAISWAPDWGVIREIFRFGLPAGFQGIALNVGGVLLLGFVGALDNSAEAQAAYTVGYTQLFSLITWTSMGLMASISAIVGQSLGAQKPDRARRVARVGAAFGMTMAVPVGLLFVIAPRPLLSLFGFNDENVIRLGTELLAFLSISGLFITIAFNYNGALQGAGDTRSPLFITIFSQLLLPVGLLFSIQALTPLRPVHVWTAILLGHFFRGLLTVLRFEQGKWTKIRVEIGSGQ